MIIIMKIIIIRLLIRITLMITIVIIIHGDTGADDNDNYDNTILYRGYLAANWVPSIHKAVLRACALYTANCSGISLGGLKWFPCVQAC